MNSKISTATTILAGLAILITIASYIAVYASAPNVPTGKRVLGCLVMSIWSASPYLGILAASYFCAERGIISLGVLGITMLSVALASYVGILVLRNPTDGQGAMALAFLPAAQWLILIVVGAPLLVWRFFSRTAI